MIYTDHASVRTASHSPHLSDNDSLDFFLYRVQIEEKYKPVKQNLLASALSRRPYYELAHVTNLSSFISDLIRTAYARDDHCVALLRDLGSDDFKGSDIDLSAHLRARLHRYFID